MIGNKNHADNVPDKAAMAPIIASTGAALAPMHWHETLHDGSNVLIRPIQESDGSLEREFIARLSPEARENRFLGQVNVSDDLVRGMTKIDFGRDLALVALRSDGGAKLEIGVGRFCLATDGQSCECAVVVSDEWQKKGLGTLLMRRLIDIARARGIKRMVSIDLATNIGMRNLAHQLGFQRQVDEDYPYEVIHTLNLS